MAAATFGREGQREFLLEGVVVPFQTGATNTVKQAGVTLSPSESDRRAVLTDKLRQNICRHRDNEVLTVLSIT